MANSSITCYNRSSSWSDRWYHPDHRIKADVRSGGRNALLLLREVLPGANCGACGFAGCADYAARLWEMMLTSAHLSAR